MNKNKINVAKKIVSMIVGIGTTKIVHAIIENNVSTDTTTSKVTVAAASGAIGYAASEHMSEYTNAKIDEAFDWYVKNIKNRNTSK